MRLLLSTTVAAFMALGAANAQTSMFAPQPAVKAAVEKVVDGVKPKPKAKPSKPHPGLNSALIESDDLDASQVSHETLAAKTPKGCSFTGGQEIQSSILVPESGETGFYLLNATCGKDTKQYVYIAHSEGGLKDVLFTQMRDNKTSRIYFQKETRRLFSKVGEKLREIEWQPIAKKNIKKTSSLYKGLFGTTVPKAKPPEI
jgi:hypothetical protein